MVAVPVGALSCEVAGGEESCPGLELGFFAYHLASLQARMHKVTKFDKKSALKLVGDLELELVSNLLAGSARDSPRVPDWSSGNLATI